MVGDSHVAHRVMLHSLCVGGSPPPPKDRIWSVLVENTRRREVPEGYEPNGGARDQSKN